MNATDLAARAATAKAPMPQTATTTIRLGDLAAVKRLGAALARELRRGDAILLRGDLGAGKTELARAVVRARMDTEVEVPSPTFTLIQTYETPDLVIAHADLYRVEQAGELAELGLDEALDDGAVLVEWPERADGLWPATRLEIALSILDGGQERQAILTAYGDWTSRLPCTKNAMA